MKKNLIWLIGAAALVLWLEEERKKRTIEYSCVRDPKTGKTICQPKPQGG